MDNLTSIIYFVVLIYRCKTNSTNCPLQKEAEYLAQSAKNEFIANTCREKENTTTMSCFNIDSKSSKSVCGMTGIRKVKNLRLIKNKIEPEYHCRKLDSNTYNKNQRKQKMSQEAIPRQRRQFITSIHHKSLRW